MNMAYNQFSMNCVVGREGQTFIRENVNKSKHFLRCSGIRGALIANGLLSASPNAKKPGPLSETGRDGESSRALEYLHPTPPARLLPRLKVRHALNVGQKTSPGACGLLEPHRDVHAGRLRFTGRSGDADPDHEQSAGHMGLSALNFETVACSGFVRGRMRASNAATVSRGRSVSV